jgi:hypothetical protein
MPRNYGTTNANPYLTANRPSGVQGDLYYDSSVFRLYANAGGGLWYKQASEADIVNIPRRVFFARNTLTDAAQNSVWTVIGGLSYTHVTTETRLIKVSIHLQVSVITANVTSPSGGIQQSGLATPPIAATPNVLRTLATPSAGGGVVTTGTAIFAPGETWVVQPAGSVTYMGYFNGGGSTGSLRAALGACHLSVEDWGPTSD